MPFAYQLTPHALEDLRDIWDYISEDNPNAANRVESAILAACAALGRFRLLGSKRTEITSLPVRFWTVTRFPSFVVVYRPATKPLQVVAILHTKRDFRARIDDQSTG